MKIASAQDTQPQTPQTPLPWLDDFQPRRFLTNGHLQTIAGNFLPRQAQLPPPEDLLVEVDAEDGSQILCHCHWQPADLRSQRLTVILVHGLEGSSNSQYVLGNGAKAWAAGCNVVRMNMRNCGATDHLTPGLYNSALSADVGAVVKQVVRQQSLHSIALVASSMDLAASPIALHKPWILPYEWRFLRGLFRRTRLKASLFPHLYSADRLAGIRSLWDFDDRITAYYCGYCSAADYYHRASATLVADRIAVPTLVIHSLDDPFIRMLPPTRDILLANPHITLIETAHGGHCAFLAPASGHDGYDGYWAERAVLGFLVNTCSDTFAGRAK